MPAISSPGAASSTDLVEAASASRSCTSRPKASRQDVDRGADGAGRPNAGPVMAFIAAMWRTIWLSTISASCSSSVSRSSLRSVPGQAAITK